MYEEFFGLRERPFDLTSNPRFLVMTEVHSEVLSNLEYGIASRKGITLLIGEAGSGKTTLIHAAIQQQPEQVHCVHINNPTLSREEFVETLAAQFGLSAQAMSSKATMLRELESLLRERYAAGETTVLIIDEAQSLSLELLEEVRLLANIETEEVKLLSVIVAGQPELAARLNEARLRQFKQRVALRCELRPLTEVESAGYIAGRIAAAGGVGAEVFTRDAVSLIYRRSGGIPRTISVIADNALVGGLAAEVRPVGSQIVREVCRDFDLSGGGNEAGRGPGTNPVPASVGQPAESSYAIGARRSEPLERPASPRLAPLTGPVNGGSVPLVGQREMFSASTGRGRGVSGRTADIPAGAGAGDKTKDQAATPPRRRWFSFFNE